MESEARNKGINMPHRRRPWPPLCKNLGISILALIASTGPLSAPPAGEGRRFNERIIFSENGYTTYGDWKAWGFIKPGAWQPGAP